MLSVVLTGGPLLNLHKLDVSNSGSVNKTTLKRSWDLLGNTMGGRELQALGESQENYR